MELTRDEIERTAKWVPGAVVVYVFDGGLECIYTSADVFALAGFTAEEYAEIGPHDAMENVIPAYRAALVEKIKEGLAADEDIDAVYRIPNKKSGPVWVHSRARHIGELDGKPVLLCTIVNASSENAQQRALVEYSGSPIYVIDADTFEILYMNQACINLFSGRKPEPGQACYAYKHGFAEPCAWCPIMDMKGDSCRFPDFYDERTRRWHEYSYHRIEWFGTPAIAVYAFDITARKIELSEIESNRKRYEKAIEIAHLVVWEYDKGSRRVVMSETASSGANYARFGFSKVIEDVPASIVDLIEDECVDDLLEMYRKVDAGQDASCEVWFKVKPGREPRCERLTYQVERDEQGTVVGAHGIGQDITAEKKIEERYARETEMLSRNISENMISKAHANLTKNAMLEYEGFGDVPTPPTAGDTYDDALEIFADMVDYNLSGEPLKEVLSRENLVRRYQHGETQLEFTYRWSVPDKVPIWSSTIMHMFTTPTTGDLECFSYTYDVTDKALERQIISKLTDLGYDELGFIYPATGSYTIYRIERNGGSVTKSSGGYDSGLDRHLGSALIEPEQVADIRRSICLAAIVEGLRKERVYSYSNPIHRPGGKERQKLFRFSYLDGRKDTVFFCMSDITDQYESELGQIEALKAAKLDADRANEAKSAFLSSMSHDIRTPLNGVIGFTDLAIKENDPEKKLMYLKRIESSGELLLDLVNDTLELSRIESGKMTLEPEEADAYDLAENVVIALRPSADLKGIKIEPIVELPHEMVYIDKLKYQKILLNLLSNAIKYTPEGGRIRLFFLALEPTAGSCNRRIVVEDNGIGMSPEFQERMFEPFAQEKRNDAGKVVGTGLGLAIIKRIVDMMGGTIAVESTVGKGSRFTVDLPIEVVAEMHAACAVEHAPELSLAGRRVLLCEDNWMNAEIAETLLKEKGIMTDTAGNGREGLEKFQASAVGLYDAILMDVRMPVMDGREATRAIRALDRADAGTIPIIALTADAFAEEIDDNLGAGMNAHITKPISPDLLYAELEKCILRRSVEEQAAG